jgi:hypothetical protein
LTSTWSRARKGSADNRAVPVSPCLQAINLRWGVREEAALDRQTMRRERAAGQRVFASQAAALQWFEVRR